jgi:uncharacterized protein (TIGR03437 family)
LKRYGVACVLLLFPAVLLAQRDRIAGPIDRNRTVSVKGHVSPIARPQFDLGPVEPSRRLSLITLMLQPPDSQQADLLKLLADQQDPASPAYHQWLTPEEYADRFGASPADTAAIASWLRSEGFQVDDVSRGRSWIVFSGTAAQVTSAFRTELHQYQVDGALHFANATDPSVPAVLAPLVRGFLGLDDVAPQPHGHSFKPNFTSGASHYLAPDDLATIYDLNPLYNSNINGTGQKIAIAGRTDVNVQDIRSFRTKYNLPNLPVNDPQFVRVTGSADPGTTADLDEADLDLQVSGEIARNATIIYVFSTNVDSSVLFAISQNLAPVISYSYGICEPKRSSGYSANLQAAAQQANAQGITWVVSSGDSGAAECDPAFSATNAQATQGQFPSFPATIPEVTGVGGTQFNEGSGNYWAANNSSHGGSALGYIPEIAWNESTASRGLASSGGGLSTFYPKPTWQTGPGVPSQNVRAAPDVSLAAAGHDGYRAFSGGQELIFSGTSAAAPAFAGMLALLNQYQVTNGLQASSGQGNINPNIYRLAQSGSNVFHDITASGNSVPCVANTPNCVGGFLGFNAGTGYDLATGWGSVDGNNLITQWNNRLANTTTTVTANPANVGLNASTQITATVRASGSSAVPTGAVSFNLGNTALGTANLSNGTATITVFGSQLPAGSDTITAHYSGNTNFNGSSGTVAINVSVPSSNSAVVPSVTPNPVYQEQADTDGYSWFYTVRLTEVAGGATTLTGFTIGGTDYSAQISDFFGSNAIAARGSLSSNIRTQGLNVPTSLVFGFSGRDPNGQTWTQQISVPFYGPQTTASMALSSVPGVVRQNTKVSSDCQWFQHLGLEEQNGHSVRITKFTAGGFDLSDQVDTFFGASTLPALGSLLAGVCWSGVTPVPQIKTYEIDGIDDVGNQISTTLSASFDAPLNSGALTTSKGTLSLAVSKAGLAQSATINVNLPAGQPWTVSVFPSNRTTRWLVAFPQSGTGPTTVTVFADSSSISNGLYTATLVFQATNTVPQFVDVGVRFAVGPGSGTIPVLSTGGVLNAASFALNNAPVAAGSLVSIFGSHMAIAGQQASVLPLQTTFNGANVTFNGIPAPLLYVSPTQINAQVPFGVDGATAQVQASTVDGFSNTITVNLASAAPGLISQTQNGTGAGVITDAIAFTLVTPSNPIARGKVITIYAVGVGPVSFQPTSGAPAPFGPLAQSTNPVTVSIGGVTVLPQFSGLTPGFVGLFQLNVTVPANAPTGSAVPVTVTASGAVSNVVTMAIR